MILIFQGIENTLRHQKQRGHFADGILEYIFLNENICTSNKISLKIFHHKGLIVDKSALVQGDGLAPNRRQAITWANDGQDLCHHMASLGHHVLKEWNSHWIYNICYVDILLHEIRYDQLYFVSVALFGCINHQQVNVAIDD